MRHVFLVGAKSLGAYGGYETFINKLTEYHADNKNIKYHVACKANGQGAKRPDGAVATSVSTYTYHNADCFEVTVPEYMGPAQAIYYDCKALSKCIEIIKKEKIENPIVYVMACRIGPFFGRYARAIHKLGGKVFLNPDGHEWKRAKWNRLVRVYWKMSEELMVKKSDLIICDSINIEKYIETEYDKYAPITTYIAYGADVEKSKLADDDLKFVTWMNEHDLKIGNYYMCCGRFVPENSFEIMLREFMKSNVDRDFAIITTKNDNYLAELDKRLKFSIDKRIKFVGTVYDNELLKKIRECAYGNFHGHTVGGTNPSLLEALGATDLNLLIDVGFNREVAEDTALYWLPDDGELSTLIEKCENVDRERLGRKAKQRIKDAYSWEYITNEYERVFRR